MRSLLITAALFVSTALSTATSGPFLQVKQTVENGNVQFIGKNISHQPIVAYVVAAEWQIIVQCGTAFTVATIRSPWGKLANWENLLEGAVRAGTRQSR